VFAKLEVAGIPPGKVHNLFTNTGSEPGVVASVKVACVPAHKVVGDPLIFIVGGLPPFTVIEKFNELKFVPSLTVNDIL
jgi:hypothetical protein